MADWLATHLVRMQGAGSPLVVDTNVLLQCQRLDSVNWTNVIEGGARVMIPLRVLEEIDTKKHSDSKRLRQIARGLLPWIDELFGSGAGPVELAPSVTVELLLAERPRYKPSDADEEILDVAHDVLQFAGSVLLMTGDTGMRVRATTEGLDVLRLPDAWRRKTDDDPA